MRGGYSVAGVKGCVRIARICPLGRNSCAESSSGLPARLQLGRKNVGRALNAAIASQRAGDLDQYSQSAS
jgi:hypothetical protein